MTVNKVDVPAFQEAARRRWENWSQRIGEDLMELARKNPRRRELSIEQTGRATRWRDRPRLYQMYCRPGSSRIWHS